MPTLVELRPLPLKKWHNKSGKESFSQKRVIEALYNAEIGGLDTGLTEEEEKKYSIKLGANIDNKFTEDAPHPFWGSKAAWIYLENNTQVFDIDKPIDYVKVKVLKRSKFIANSIADWEKGLYPDATHVIYDEHEDMNVKATKVEARKNATVFAATKLSKDDKIALIQILGKESLNLKGMTDSYVEVKLADIIEREPENFMRYANMGKAEVTTRASVLQMLQKGILVKDGLSIKYLGNEIGLDYEDAVKFFMEERNSKLKILILEKLNSA